MSIVLQIYEQFIPYGKHLMNIW